MSKGVKEANEYYEDDVLDDEKQHKMLNMLEVVNKKRFTNYNMWLALLVMMKTHKLPRDKFIEISHASGYERFDESDCISAWIQCKENTSFSISLLYGWLKQDGVNIKKFFPTKSPIVVRLLHEIKENGELTDYSISEALFETYQDNLYYTDSHGWIHYNGTKWVIGDKNVIMSPIMKYLSEDLLAWYHNEYKRLIIKDDSEKSKYLSLIKSQALQLQKACKMESVFKVAQGRFMNNDVLSTFDQKPNWFCFENQKAIDITTKEVVTIYATDRILTTCGYPMPERNTDEMKLMEDVLKTIIPDTDYASFLSSMSIFLYGENINEVFIVWKGVGRNGKGLTHDALKTVLGENHYYVALPVDILTDESKGSGRACSELAQARFARCLMTSEPDDNSVIRKTKINLLTGRDPLTVRFLHKNAFTYVPKFTLGMMCNDIPKVSGGISEAIEKRMKIREFPYQFVKEPQLEFQREIKEELKNLVKTEPYRNGLLYLLIDAWHSTQGKYVTSISAEQEQNEYVKINNPISVFLDKYRPSDTFIRIKVLYDEYNKSNDKIVLSSQRFKGLLIQAKIKIQEDKHHGTKVFLELQ